MQGMLFFQLPGELDELTVALKAPVMRDTVAAFGRWLAEQHRDTNGVEREVYGAVRSELHQRLHDAEVEP